MSDRLIEKVAVVTGAARGQGAAHGRLFAEEGAKVVLCDVLDDEGQELADQLLAEGFEASYQHLDVSDEEQWKRVMAAIDERYQRLDVLVNNAGVLGSMKAIDQEDLEDWNRTVAVNLTGVMLGMKHAVPLMRRTGDGGSIINTSSIYGVTGAQEYGSYQATKGGVLQLTRSGANTYAPDGIRVNSVCPGIVMTPMLAEEAQEGVAELMKAVPLGRGAEAREISYGMLYLASDEAAYVTGIDLVIDGGFLAQ